MATHAVFKDPLFGSEIHFIDAITAEDAKDIFVKCFPCIKTEMFEEALAGFDSPELNEVLYIWGNKHHIHHIAHECVHAAAYTLHRVGVPVSFRNDETLAYYVQFLMNNIYP